MAEKRRREFTGVESFLTDADARDFISFSPRLLREVGAMLNIKPQVVDDLINVVKEIYTTNNLERPLKEGEEYTLVDVTKDQRVNVENESIRNAEIDTLNRDIRKELTKQEYSVVSLLYGFDEANPRRRKEAAAELKMTESKLDRIEAGALRKLRNSKSLKHKYQP